MLVLVFVINLKNRRIKIKTIITENWLIEHHACIDGADYFESLNVNEMTVYDLMCVLVAQEKYAYLQWLLKHALHIKSLKKLAIYAAEKVLPIFEAIYPEDNRPRAAIEASKNNDVNAAYAADAAGNAAYAAYVSATVDCADNAAKFDYAANAANAANAAYAAYAAAKAVYADKVVCAYAYAAANVDAYAAAKAAYADKAVCTYAYAAANVAAYAYAANATSMLNNTRKEFWLDCIKFLNSLEEN